MTLCRKRILDAIIVDTNYKIIIYAKVVRKNRPKILLLII